MSMEMISERVCYVQCNFCSTILAVNVPCNNMFNIVTVRCGHCANLLSVNMGAANLVHQSHVHHVQDFQLTKQQSVTETAAKDSSSSSSKSNSRFGPYHHHHHHHHQHQTDHRAQPTVLNSPVRPPEKRQRVPSAYNRFIKEEIQRIKASNPEISHREAFSTAAKNWAHFPHIHFGLKLESKNNQTKQLDHSSSEEVGTQKSFGF